MKVKLLISRAGAGFVQKAGDIVEVSDNEAKRLFEAVPPKAIPVRDDGVPVEFAAFDHNGDGRPGGSKPRKRRK